MNFPNRTRALLTTLIVLAFSAATLGTAAQNVYERLPSDYETLGWAASIAFTEEPTVDADGNVFFTDIPSSRIFRLSTGGDVTTFRHVSNRANGLIFDNQGRLIACEGGDGEGPARLTRTDLATGEIEVLVERFEGKRINRPNDLTIDGKGRIYFTDRRRRADSAPDRTNVAAVYRVDSDGTVHRILTEPEITSPNGIMISPDDEVLYLVESNLPGFWGAIRAYDLGADGSVSNMRVFHDFGKGRSADGLCVDTEGHLYAAAGLVRRRGTDETLDTRAGIYVFEPSGVLLEFIPVPVDTITNCAFGGPDMRTLYITAGMSLLTVRTEVAGTPR